MLNLYTPCLRLIRISLHKVKISMNVPGLPAFSFWRREISTMCGLFLCYGMLCLGNQFTWMLNTVFFFFFPPITSSACDCYFLIHFGIYIPLGTFRSIDFVFALSFQSTSHKVQQKYSYWYIGWGERIVCTLNLMSHGDWTFLWDTSAVFFSCWEPTQLLLFFFFPF